MNSLINVCERLKFFREIHKSGERPPYIDICRLKSDRSLLSKFRISAHSLAIEKGRYPNIETRGGSRGGGGGGGGGGGRPPKIGKNMIFHTKYSLRSAQFL